MGWPLAVLVSLPLLLHLRQHPLPVATVAPEVVHEDHVLAVSFGHVVDDATTGYSQSLRGEKVNTGHDGPAPGFGLLPQPVGVGFFGVGCEVPEHTNLSYQTDCLLDLHGLIYERMVA
jgi:hypothetical protein